MKLINNNAIKIAFVFILVITINGCMMMGMGVKRTSIETISYLKVQSINSNDIIDQIIEEVVLDLLMGMLLWKTKSSF